MRRYSSWRFRKSQRTVLYSMSLRTILAAPVRAPLRLLATVVAAILLSAGALMVAASAYPSPRFALDQSQRGVHPLDYPSWRRAGDWLRGRKYAVLTFDDGPYGSGVDERILGILARHHAHAMFFLVCSHLDAARDHVVSEIETSGNIIGNHSYDHAHLNHLKLADLQREISECSARIASLTRYPPRYFRPPFGETSSEIMQVAQSAGMQQMLWNANTEDSWQRQSNQILYWGLEQTEDGSILLMHDSPTTAIALDRLLTHLEKRGFVFVLPAEVTLTDEANRTDLLDR
jgi:peptidoglycan-N-acetylglucosamine deacetylase